MSKKIMLLGIAIILAAIALSITINNIIAFAGGIAGLLITIVGLVIRDNDTKN